MQPTLHGLAKQGNAAICQDKGSIKYF